MEMKNVSESRIIIVIMSTRMLYTVYTEFPVTQLCLAISHLVICDDSIHVKKQSSPTDRSCYTQLFQYILWVVLDQFS